MTSAGDTEPVDHQQEEIGWRPERQERESREGENARQDLREDLLELTADWWEGILLGAVSLKGDLSVGCGCKHRYMHVCVSRSVVSDSVTPWTVAHQAPMSMEFCRQEYWSGLSCPPPGDFPNPGIKPTSLMSP